MEDPQDRKERLALRALADTLAALVLEVDEHGVVRDCTGAGTAVVGRSPAELVGTTLLDRVHPDEKAALQELLDGSEGRGPSRLALRLRDDRGDWRRCELRRAAGTSGDRTLVVRDASHEEAVLAELRASEDRYRAIAENATDLIIEVDADGRFLYASPNSIEILGFAPEELVGTHIGEIIESGHIHSADRASLLAGFQRRVHDEGRGGRGVYRIFRKDGQQRWFESRARTYRTSDGETHAVVISRDVSELLEAQRDLAEIEKRYELLGETSRDLITESGPDRRMLFVSRSVRGLLGYEPEELLGTYGAELIHPDDRERVRADFYASPGNPDVTFTPPYRCRLKDGSYRWFEGTALRYMRSENDGPYAIGLLRDIHDRVTLKAEREALEERVQRSQRLEGLGVMAGGIAHDFNNLLTPILGQTSLALSDMPEDAPARARLEKVRSAARRAAKLTNQMLAYAGAGPLMFEATDLSELVREMGQLLESTVSGKAVVEFDLAQGLAPVEADGAQLSQVVMNLISNAAEAVGDGTGSIRVRTRTLRGNAVEQADLVVGDVDPDLRYACFEVEDTGVGMTAETRARIFDPFFTTKFTGRGLGLAATLGIVRGHGGAIELRSEPGRGTRFRVLLPPRASSDPALREAHPEASWRSHGTILLADDDDGVREVASDTLEACGFRVLAARDGREALELFERHGDTIRAVLLDRTMPVVSGEETFARLRALRPHVPVVIVSGYSEESVSQEIADNRPDGFLKKPFVPSVLRETLRKVLDD